MFLKLKDFFLIIFLTLIQSCSGGSIGNFLEASFDSLDEKNEAEDSINMIDDGKKIDIEKKVVSKKNIEEIKKGKNSKKLLNLKKELNSEKKLGSTRKINQFKEKQRPYRHGFREKEPRVPKRR